MTSRQRLEKGLLGGVLQTPNLESSSLTKYHAKPSG
jgi:hypothetical protein